MGRTIGWSALALALALVGACRFDSSAGATKGGDIVGTSGSATPGDSEASSRTTTPGGSGTPGSSDPSDPTSKPTASDPTSDDDTTGDTDPTEGGSGTSSGGCVPVDEVCDDEDNDCDGKIDEHSGANMACGDCVSEFWSGAAYYFCDGGHSWGEARERCQALGADLVSILSQDENQYVGGTLDVLSPNRHKWIGYHSPAMNSSEWEWADGSPGGFEEWESGQPNNYSGVQWCAAIHPYFRDWNDFNCANDGSPDFSTNGYVCKDDEP